MIDKNLHYSVSSGFQSQFRNLAREEGKIYYLKGQYENHAEKHNSHTSVFLHDIEVFQIEQFANPGVIGEIIHGKPNDHMTWKTEAKR